MESTRTRDDEGRQDADAAEDWWLDRALDRTVALGYSNIGYAVRSRRWRDLPAGALDGRRVLLTGGTAGIGKAAARRLAELGAEVHVVGHGAERAEQAIDDLRAAAPGERFTAHVADMGDLEDVRRLATTLASTTGGWWALLHDAGTMAEERTETAQGHEVTLSVHVLGPFLLTQLLAPRLHDGGRVVFMASGGMYAASVAIDDLEHHEDYSGPVAYARTKRMLVDLAPRWDRRLADHATAHSMHPGWVNTPGVATYLPKFRALTRPFMRTPDQGADTLVWLTAAEPPASHGGSFWHDRVIRPRAYGGRNATSPADVDRLWDFCDEATRPYAATLDASPRGGSS